LIVKFPTHWEYGGNAGGFWVNEVGVDWGDPDDLAGRIAIELEDRTREARRGSAEGRRLTDSWNEMRSSCSSGDLADAQSFVE
jgi:hypothetical protein